MKILHHRAILPVKNHDGKCFLLQAYTDKLEEVPIKAAEGMERVPRTPVLQETVDPCGCGSAKQNNEEKMTNNEKEL